MCVGHGTGSAAAMVYFHLIQLTLRLSALSGAEHVAFDRSVTAAKEGSYSCMCKDVVRGFEIVLSSGRQYVRGSIPDRTI